MKPTDAVNLTAIMEAEGIRQITRFDGGYRVILCANGGTDGFGRTVGEAFNAARANVREAA